MKEKLEDAARELAKEVGPHNLTRETVCTKAEVAEGSFGYVTGKGFKEWLAGLELPETNHPIVGHRLNPDLRKTQILAVAFDLSIEKGYVFVQVEDIAEVLNVTPQLIKHYYSDIETLREEVVKLAIKHSNFAILAQGVINRHPLVMDLDVELKTEAIRATILS